METTAIHQGRGASARERARAASRFLGFVGSTTRHLLALRAGLALRGDTPAEKIRHIQAWSRELLDICGVHVRVTGAPPEEGGLLVSNHRSYLDIAVLGAHCRCLFLAKEEIADWPLLGAAARSAGCVLVRRGDKHSGAEATRTLRALAQSGVLVTVFPEGTTSAGPGVLPFKAGAFRVAAACRLAILPAAIDYREPELSWTGDDGTFVSHFLSHLGRPRTEVSLAFGPPVRDESGARLRAVSHAWIQGTLVPRDA
jgi:lyso-ornithine lipid O-acyltransferase